MERQGPSHRRIAGRSRAGLKRGRVGIARGHAACHRRRDGRPGFATAQGATGTPQGWRAGKAKDGVAMIDVASGEIALNGLAINAPDCWY